MLGRWIQQFESEDGQSFRGNGKLSPEQVERGPLGIITGNENKIAPGDPSPRTI